ncbi:kinesin [Chloropicon primus]|uniref:Kinesin-like protein n=3 Tax=Chloropicon primus TaxID=1764295 RepID=A0A5B8MZL4_9CHLO|nr:kinesin [Chloropicon primus]UPR04074.1 kinesin [Chloropicon primus]|eukprot:QDZ24864.1 kinesin [Chloropicon primus]
MSRPPTPGGGGGGGDRGGDLNSTLHHGSTIKFLKFSRNGTPAVTLDRNADLSQLGDDYEEVDYNVEDILRMAEHLGMDTDKDEDFLWIAAEAYDAEVPEPWKEFFDDSGEVYFHNTRTGDVSRDHPLDHYYRILYGIVRQMADKGLEVNIEAARKDAAMALPDQNMQEAIEESKEKIQQMAAHNSSAFAKYVPQPKSDLEYVVHDLQMALKRAEQERLEHERRVSELSAKVMTIQNKEGTPVNQDILNSLQARLSRIESAGFQNGGPAVGSSSEGGGGGDAAVSDRLARLERESSEAAKEALRAHRERAEAQAEASQRIETLEREKAELERRLGQGGGGATRAGGQPASSGGMSKASMKPLLDIQKKVRDLSSCVSTAKDEVARQTRNFGSALSVHSCSDDPMAWAIQSLVKKLRSVSSAAKSAIEEAENKIGPVMAERRRLFNELLRAKGNIRVFCRVRPLNSQEGRISCVEFPNEDRANRQVALVPQERQQNGRSMSRKDFEFDRVFNETSSQTTVYEESVKPLVQSALDGFNVCVFAYGQTGSGKTHTMEGPENDRGVTFRAIKELFTLANGECAVPGVVEYTFNLSMLEIYNEQIKDLLEEKSTVASKKLDIKMREDGTGVYVPNLTEKPVSTAEEVLQLLYMGSKNRSVGVTMMNEHSSRSHLVMMISCVNHNVSKQTSFTSKISFIDLAGSERVSKSCVEGERLKEASYINKSLSALGDVIASLASAQTRSTASHIPFRNSKLTYLLSDSLGNECKTMLFVNISPSVLHAHESLCSLMFAFRARNVNLSSSGASLSNMKKLREVAELAKKEQQRLGNEMSTKSESFGKEKDALMLKIAALQKDVAGKNLTIQDLKSKPSFQPPPPSCPPPSAKPMRQHNAKVESDTKDLGQELIALREMNKNLTDRVRTLREEKAKMQKDMMKKEEQYREMSEKYRRVSSLQRANAAINKLRPKSRSKSRPGTAAGS